MAKKKPVEYSKTLEQLENDFWGDPTYDSYVVRTCHAMRKKPLKEVTPEELRLVIGQGFSLDYLIPLAIELLKTDILTSGDLTEGSLLANVISRQTVDYWKRHKSDWEVLRELIDRNIHLLNDRMIISRIADFRALHRV